jgi:hypothetical protein
VFDDLTRLAAALSRQEAEAPSPAFALWRTLWIAANGPLGRKKAVVLDGIPDPYLYLFGVESALVFVAHGLVAACGGRLAPSAAAGLFEGWRAAPPADTTEAAAALSRHLAALTPGERLALLASDPFRTLYHALLPKAIRHTLGAYLSPPDLCAHVLDGIAVDRLLDTSDPRLVEPNCGLGAFFSALLARGLPRAHLGRTFARQVFGVEKNLGSWAVARALHAAIVGELGGEAAAHNVVWADSVFVDEAAIAAVLGADQPQGGRVLVPGFLKVTLPADRVTPAALADTGEVLEAFDGVSWQPVDRPLRAWLAEQPPLTQGVLREALDGAARLESMGGFEFIAGNPPWVNWENLDPAYKALILPSWPPLGLFAMVGRDRAFAKEDLSVLATYAACLRFGRAGTRVGLLLPQGLFQSRKNAKGFRRFRLGGSGIHLRVDGVTDFSAYAAFGDAKNRTAAFFCTLGGEPATYPVPYRRFVPGGAFEGLRAVPSAPDDPTSNWALYAEHESTGPATAVTRTYRARTGVFTGGANAVFYLRVLDGEGPLLRVENDTDRAKVKVERVEVMLEPDWLYPFAKGRDLGPWTVDRPPANAIVVPHTAETKMRPVPPDTLGRTAPRTLAYLARHEALLRVRPSLTGMDKASVAEGFYALLRVGDYTFAPYKVAWKYISRTFCCAVVGPSPLAGALRPTVLQEKLISIAFDDEAEAHYVCAFLSTTAVRRDVERRIVGTQVSVHVIEDIHIPPYDAADPVHRALAAVCRDGHADGGLTPVRQALLDGLHGSLADGVGRHPCQ